MSLRLRLFTLGMRWTVRPVIARKTDLAQARRSFDRMAQFLRVPGYVLHLVDAGPVPMHWVSVGHCDPDWVILYLHGGGYVVGSADSHVGLTARLARLTGLRVAVPDYRLAPENSAPAAFDDAKAAHGALLAKGYAPGRIILAGDSAGGGMALALMADLCARGLRPAGLFAFSPWTDLAMEGASLKCNAALDPLLPVHRMSDLVAMVRGDLAVKDPRISPLYASFDQPPPVFLQVGTVEILLEDTRRMAAVLRAAGGQVEVTEWRGCPHVWHLLDGYLPEARQALREVAGFVGRVILSSQPPTGN